MTSNHLFERKKCPDRTTSMVRILTFLLKRIAAKITQILSMLTDLFFYGTLWRGKFDYRRDPKIIDVRWKTVYTKGMIRVPINILRAKITTREGKIAIPIEETPHYQWFKYFIEDNKNIYSDNKYREFIENFHPKVNVEEQLAYIQELARSIQSQPNSSSLITIVTYPPKINLRSGSYEVRIYDGVHRAAIAKVLGHRFIQCRIK